MFDSLKDSFKLHDQYKIDFDYILVFINFWIKFQRGAPHSLVTQLPRVNCTLYPKIYTNSLCPLLWESYTSSKSNTISLHLNNYPEKKIEGKLSLRAEWANCKAFFFLNWLIERHWGVFFYSWKFVSAPPNFERLLSLSFFFSFGYSSCFD